MPLVAHKRTSTVERLTLAKLKRIVRFCQVHNCGFIVRWNGQEIGARVENGELVLDTRIVININQVVSYYQYVKVVACFQNLYVRKNWEVIWC